MPRPPKLTFVPDREPTGAQRVRARLGAIPRPHGLLECPRCKGRAAATVRGGVIVKDGRKTSRGTLIASDCCASCYPTIVRMVPGGEGPKRVT